MTTTVTYKGFTLQRDDSNQFFWSVSPPSTNPNLIGEWETVEQLKTAIDLINE